MGENNPARKYGTREKGSKKKITIEVDEDDPCLKKNEIHEEETLRTFRGEEFIRSPGNDPRFQQQNQTQRCFVMYTDFYRCEHILGKGSEACIWFKDVFTSICPKAWVEQWDELRLTGRLPWHKYRTQGDFPGNKYGE
ncbi:PREDICTED: cytochrome c oxidase subunit 6b-1-like isoform X1 [Trachymyrmex cornetzi]|uniref:Cytochrome c oxidase subunit 6B1 n=1 Tax=Trachymyrmex cornetzi TaxID=471704 RepID=A0A195DS98_9HYME|nr:PREDICTED: cytochrome c oxidase subunit 6b-1-like isoform X1 [Trachymyrmex cornetzi]KYN15394.1 Cytochrome c oxidase subunit 6B1 [Trachymyrmex cornetzi]